MFRRPSLWSAIPAAVCLAGCAKDADAHEAQMLAAGEPSPAAALLPPASPIGVTLRMEAMHAISTTEGEDRDELYFLVVPPDPRSRLPGGDDDYEAYHQKHLQEGGWTNKDQQRLGTPILGTGSLAPGQESTWYVLICEQDGGAVIINEPEPSDPLEKLARSAHQEGHDVIGGFAVSTRNQGGVLQVTSWRGGPKTEFLGPNPQSGPNAAYFKARGDGGCEYNFIANLVPSGTPVPTPPAPATQPNPSSGHVYPK